VTGVGFYFYWTRIRPSSAPIARQPVFRSRITNEHSTAKSNLRYLAQLKPQFSFSGHTREEFLDWRTKAREELRKTFRLEGYEWGFKVKAEVIATDRLTENLWRKKFLLQLDPYYYSTVYLFIPKTEAKNPAILVIPGHGFGKAQTAGEIQTGVRASALALAKAGFVTMTMDFCGVLGRLALRRGITNQTFTFRLQLAEPSSEIMFMT
jgi:hypothetical protein